MSLDVKDILIAKGNFRLHADFCLESDKILVLLGPSGSGKTTLLRAIAGLESIEKGSISLEGARIDKLPPEKRNIGFVFQDLALFEQLTVRQNIGYSLGIHRIKKTVREERIDQLAKKFKIENLLARFPYQLSGGERQRVAFARSLAHVPSLLLLDEPLSALDAPLRKEMRRLIRIWMQEAHLPAIHVTHDVEEAIDLADEIIILREGELVQGGTLETLAANPGSGWLARFMNLGIVLPISEPNFHYDGAYFTTILAGGRQLRISPENIHIDFESEAKKCVYFPFSAIQRRIQSKVQPFLCATIMRQIPIFNGMHKLVLSLSDIDNYFFEMEEVHLHENLTRLAEPAQIALYIDETQCQLIPEEPSIQSMRK